MTHQHRPQTLDAVDLLQEVVAALTCAKFGLLEPPDELVILTGSSQDDLLALAGSTPEELTAHVEYGSASVLDGPIQTQEDIE
ncbi:hypothetical protein GUY44_26915 [Pimelobacter simplex]|uniref:hypothetical protein n=1 Tax=Nocardioides simplex TaxID=2045 RepID=UPI00053634B9|nr:hypothetical protein [Pimelobacter simplex]MCG8154134.1 hypothetical protein [Pimelobacter simplex]GEB15540.1 hypothetical protein NSI01_38550 [Pimelobacter simplex]SFM58473.1 hypothetical protein SAMN05421671_2543 [Pimelobacter simplex]